MIRRPSSPSPRLPLPLVLLLALTCALPGAALAQVAHDLMLSLDPAKGRLEGTDRLTLPAGHTGPLTLTLGEGLAVETATVGGEPVEVRRDGETLRLSLPAGAEVATITYAGTLAAPEPPGLAPEGTWLPGGYAWFPRATDADRLEVTVILPPGQRAAMTGALVAEEETAEGRMRATFRAYAGEPPTLFAGPYGVTERMHDGIRLRTYFHNDVPGRLSGAYLDDVARHIDHYAGVIGPYPYDGFAVVSAPHPVGLGYPGMTYVSRRILHLPFMRTQSLPHEVLHVWWGNAVRVAPGSGNWAEGLTTYMADYALADPARKDAMRRDWLRDYAALPAGEDQPLTAFRGKLHARDQVTGYGKGAFVFHMLERRIGEEAFRNGVAAVYADHRGGTAGWSDFREAFEAASDMDLSAFFDQWLTRTGAPTLALEAAEAVDGGVRVTLAQAGEPYALRVPVEVETAAGTEQHLVPLSARRRTVVLDTDAAARAVRVDPDHHLFRHLAEGERTATLRDVTLAPDAQVVAQGLPETAEETAATLAARMLGARSVDVAADWDRDRPALIVAQGAPRAVADRLGVAAPPEVPEDASAVVWSVREAPSPTLVVAVRDAAALEALVRPLPHYGRESWLAFRGGEAIARGSWEPKAENALARRL
ncbi:M1 family metallopeptidase [Caenispirillum salinarum]|uniref:M1 family metallopeptidase n=1 Tax=Caenispirillum salinarum TaxID=859058 RepID=UPI00384DA135